MGHACISRKCRPLMQQCVSGTSETSTYWKHSEAHRRMGEVQVQGIKSPLRFPDAQWLVWQESDPTDVDSYIKCRFLGPCLGLSWTLGCETCVWVDFTLEVKGNAWRAKGAFLFSYYCGSQLQKWETVGWVDRVLLCWEIKDIFLFP